MGSANPGFTPFNPGYPLKIARTKTPGHEENQGYLQEQAASTIFVFKKDRAIYRDESRNPAQYPDGVINPGCKA